MDPFSVFETLFTSGLGVDIALGFIVLEFAYLLWRAPPDTRKAHVINLVFALGPGACLMLALRCALTGTGATWVAFWLAMSLPLHMVDVLRRKL
jgi:hypothetical protein